MARPFRFTPPAGAPGLVWRERLLAVLERRWDHRLVTVVAGPGFGKTSLLVQSLHEAPDRDGDHRARRCRDVWLSCEPHDASPDRLASGLRAAAGLADTPESHDVVEELAAWVWSQAPAEVAFVLDDVHEVPTGSDGAAVLERLVAELPGNGHVVMASRHPVPVSVGRLAAEGRLVRLVEDELVLDDDELEWIATSRQVDRSLFESTGGWPALVSLVVATESELVPDYLWGEILGQLDDDRVTTLARASLVGEVDDQLATALSGRRIDVEELFGDLPLVERTTSGSAVLHPLWQPALRRKLSDVDATDAYRRAAETHRAGGRYSEAIELLIEAEEWDLALAVMRDALLSHLWLNTPRTEFGRWYQALPPSVRTRPEALLAAGTEEHARMPADSLRALTAAAEGFRDRSDVDGEAAALAIQGLVLWWLDDQAGLLGLYDRVTDLADQGSELAEVLQAIALAAVANLNGDTAGVFDALREINAVAAGMWRPLIEWFRVSASRVQGDLHGALDTISALDGVPLAGMGTQFDVDRLRTSWLLGDVDATVEGLVSAREAYLREGDLIHHHGTTIDLAGKCAWLGDHVDGAQLLELTPTRDDVVGVRGEITARLAQAAVALGRGDEAAAAASVKELALQTLATPHDWYWRDLAATALLYVLVPEGRAHWDGQNLAPVHDVGRTLGRALVQARSGDLSAMAALDWPDSGVVRSNLPVPLAVELIAAGIASNNPAPKDMLDAVAPFLSSALGRLATSPGANDALRRAAARLRAELPAMPKNAVQINLLGSLEVLHDGIGSTSPHLRRQRVRELLCSLVSHRRAHREQLSEDLWPDRDDGGRNLRVTLSYLQQVLEPDRDTKRPPYFVRSDGPRLVLETRPRLGVDVWQLEDRLARAEEAERADNPAEAVKAYQAALPLWRGDPYADLPYAEWIEPERRRLRNRYRSAALRVAELLLAAGRVAEARDAARCAVTADPTDEASYRLLARTHLADGDQRGAEHAMEECRAALAPLGLARSGDAPLR